MVHGVLDPNSVAAQLGLERDPFRIHPMGCFSTRHPGTAHSITELAAGPRRVRYWSVARGCGMTTLLHSAAATQVRPTVHGLDRVYPIHNPDCCPTCWCGSA